ncbi:MAG: response regulator [Chloroflexota bacterium]|nr:response regulator [Chloroflexota bacterium]
MGETGRGTPDELAAPGREARASGGRGVLVVDDEPAVRHLAQSALRTIGYEVTVASGGREALRAVYAESASPALLVTDIDMPGMTGIELAARLTAARPAVRVIFMTGDAESANRARDRAGFVAAVLLKPFTAGDLREAVRAAIGDPAGS